MNKLIALVCVLVFSPILLAQQGKVIKANGNKALVHFPPGTKLHVGETLILDTADSLDAELGGKGSSSGSGMNGSRDRVLGFSASLVSGSASSGGSHTSLGGTARYGWNQLTMEYGPEASFSTSSPGSNTAFSVGGFFDYNLIPNARGKVMIYGAGAVADLGSRSTGGNSSTVMTIFGGGFVKWFPLGNTVAVRGDAGLQYVRNSASSGTTSETDLAALGGLEVYF